MSIKPPPQTRREFLARPSAPFFSKRLRNVTRRPEVAVATAPTAVSDAPFCANSMRQSEVAVATAPAVMGDAPFGAISMRQSEVAVATVPAAIGRNAFWAQASHAVRQSEVAVATAPTADPAPSGMVPTATPVAGRGNQSEPTDRMSKTRQIFHARI